MKQKYSSQVIAPNPIVTILLIGVVVSLVVLPFLMKSDSSFVGTDDAAKKVITGINPEAKPWFEPLWAPPAGEMQTFLFSLQAALGAGVVGYCLGLMRGRKQGKE